MAKLSTLSKPADMSGEVNNVCFFVFQVQYPQSNAFRMSYIRDLPPVSGSIIWAKQIDRQLTAYLRRVEDVLGKN